MVAQHEVTEAGGVVEPAVVSISVKSQQRRKRFPRLGEMVRVVNRPGLFVVTRVDPRQRVADLKQRVGKVEVVDTNIPLHQVRTVPREASKAIQEFLSTGLIEVSFVPSSEGLTEVARANSIEIGAARAFQDTPAAHREPLAS